MIVGRKANPSSIDERLFESGDFYLVREGGNFAYVSQTDETLAFCPCDDQGAAIRQETLTYKKSVGKRAVIEFIKLLPFQPSITFNVTGS